MDWVTWKDATYATIVAIAFVTEQVVSGPSHRRLWRLYESAIRSAEKKQARIDQLERDLNTLRRKH
jgi:hypothetical protein